MPTPKEKPKGQAPKEKHSGFMPKEVGRIVREKYRKMAEQRQPEENEREYAAEHLQSGMEKGVAFVSDLVGREKEALCKSFAHSGNKKQSTPPSEPAPTSETPTPATAQETPDPEFGRRVNTPKEHSDPTCPVSHFTTKERLDSTRPASQSTPKEHLEPIHLTSHHTTTEHIAPAQPASRSTPKERAKQNVKSNHAIPKEKLIPSATAIAAPPEYGTWLDTVRPRPIIPKEGGVPISLMRPNLGRIKSIKQDLKLELAKKRAGNRRQTEPEPASFSVPDLPGEHHKNVPTAQAVRTHDTEFVADTVGTFPRGKEKTRPPVGTTAKVPKAGRPAPGRGRDATRPLTNPVQAVRQRLKHQAVKRAAQQGAQRAPSQIAKTAARKGATVAVRVIQAAARAVAALFGAVAGLLGCGALLAIILVIAIAGALISSPFGIFFSNQDHTPGMIPVSLAVGQINQAFSSYLDGLQSGSTYDSVEIHGAKADWVEVLAVFAVKTALYDGESAADVVTLDQDRVNRLSAVFWDMNPVRTRVEEIYHPPEDEEDSGWTEYILHIYIEGKTAEDMKGAYGFTPAQSEALDELLEERELLTWLLSDLSISDETAREVLKNLPDDISPQRRAAVEKALELVGKVNYFWGGKSYVIGWDDRWGQLTQVTSPGSSTTGSYLPFGLDCSGYLDWTFRNAGLQSDGHWYLETNLTEITWAEALPGDIVLYPDNSHVGLVVGRDAGSRVLVVHCSYSLNNVAISDGQAFGFTKIGRPNIYGE